MYSKGILILAIASQLNYFCVSGFKSKNKNKLKDVFSWKQIGYDFDGVQYTNSSDTGTDNGEPFFNQYNNVPIGLEVYGDIVFVTVPRRRPGIPSTLNYVRLHSPSRLLRPYPDTRRAGELVSVYRPRVDACGRLWMVDTGLVETPGARRQVQPPAIIVYDLTTHAQILRYQLKDSDLVNERTSGGLTSITVDVAPTNCACAYAYITDLATGGLIVFSMERRDSWRFDDASFNYDEGALNFTSAGQTIPWKDGIFSLALSEADEAGRRTAYYHPLVSTQEFSIDTQYLKHEGTSLDGQIKDAILCWNVDTELTPENVAVVAQDHQKLVYISDLKIVGDYVWVLANQIPRFVYSQLNINEYNYFINKGRIQDLIRGTVCDGCNRRNG